MVREEGTLLGGITSVMVYPLPQKESLADHFLVKVRKSLTLDIESDVWYHSVSTVANVEVGEELAHCAE